MKIIDQLISWGLMIVVFLLPWQTRWIFKEATLNGGVWEYGRLSLYLSEIILIIILILGWLRFLNYRRLKPEIVLSKTLKIIGLLISSFIVWAGLTIFWSANQLLAWHNWLLLVLAAGLAALLIFSNGQEKRKISLAFIGAGVIQALLAISQWIFQRFPQSKWLGLSGLDPATLGTSVVQFGENRLLRAYGSLPHPNILAGFLIVALLLTLILLKQGKVFRSLVYGNAVLVVLIVGLFFTFSRAAWLALIICLIVYLLSCLLKKDQWKRIVFSTIIFSLVFAGLALVNLEAVKTRLTSSERLEVKSTTERLASYGEAFGLIKNNWLTGVGLGNYTLALYQDNPKLKAWDYQPVHNVYLLVLAQLGILGLISYLMILFTALRQKSDYWILLVALLILGLFDHFLLSFYFGLMLWALVLGLNQNTDETRILRR